SLATLSARACLSDSHPQVRGEVRTSPNARYRIEHDQRTVPLPVLGEDDLHQGECHCLRGTRPRAGRDGAIWRFWYLCIARPNSLLERLAGGCLPLCNRACWAEPLDVDIERRNEAVD